jgi:hypothetical protein
VTKDRKLLELDFATFNIRRQLHFVANVFKPNIPDGVQLLVIKPFYNIF